MKKKPVKVKHIFTVLIADKNSNVLSFLKRDLVETGYMVFTAKDVRALMGIVNNNNQKPDFLIIDPVLPGVNVCSLLRELKEQNPDLPIIIHAYMSDFYDYPAIMEGVFFIEKDGHSIVHIKKAIFDMINDRQGLYIKPLNTHKGNSKWMI